MEFSWCDHYPLSGDFDVTIEFYNDAFIKGTDATSTNFYETPCYFVYTNSVNKFNVENYKEIIFARGDVWCWFDGDITKNPDALPEGATFTRTYPANWDNWVAAMKAGAVVIVAAKKRIA
jgi:hypothetical protein